MNELVPDETSSWELGQNNWLRPDRIQTNQYSKGINVSTKGGDLSPRQAFEQLTLTFDKTTVLNNQREEISISDIWYHGKFQAFIPFIAEGGAFVITIISGLFFKTELRSGFTSLLSEDIKLSQYAARINWTYADKYIVVFDYPSIPVIIDEDGVRFADKTKNEVPISSMGTYNQSRLIIADALNQFTAGDVVGNALTPDAPITFNEIFQPNSPYINQVFSVAGANPLHPISAMGLLQSVDSSTGVGPLFIATENEVYYYSTNQPRDQWTQGQFGSLLLAEVGMAGSRSFINVNSDLLFLSPGGYVHAFSSAQEAAKKWSNVSISREVENFLKPKNPELVKYSTLAYHNNRIYISANPYRTKALDRNRRPVFDYAHGGMVVLELDQLASFLSQGSPVWAGLWTGLDVMDMQSINSELFAIGKQGLRNALYRITDDLPVDIIRGRKRKIRSVVYTKEYNHGSNYTDKKEVSLVTDVADIVGQFEYKVERKTNHSSFWEYYSSWKHTAPSKTECVPNDFFVHGFAPHNFKPIVFGEPEVVGCNPITQENTNVFNTVQYRLTFEGESWKLRTFKTNAKVISAVERVDSLSCPDMEIVNIPQQSEPDWKVSWTQEITKPIQEGIFIFPNYLAQAEAAALAKMVVVEGPKGAKGERGLPGRQGEVRGDPISALVELNIISDSDLLVIVSNGVTYKVSAQTLKTYFNS